ncbi:uncharacterized protein K452DRAFT_329108 [Aplosporella prunicola CBS 121167]|uniref:non-specific serine/threonine protein kinase n=1 Tax=Aplosporella prunicola CBS 121167 TaxID=1176127 RepID=A0A6A6B2E6_9PEZI|nr:uncharacterized protein K452DRAFT_329108 [Aplosporella prunicola CBS 121167]KAF2137768.1 hypothetical protein K452DRAFT_329108 [Aplosporella prunicola CBS 121167]
MTFATSSASSSSSAFDRQQTEEETLPDYHSINYYPAHIGEVLNFKYQIITKFGYGMYSTVWLCRDLLQHRYVVLKVFIRNSMYGFQAKRELHAYKRLCQVKTDHPGKDFVRNILDLFEVEGPAGPHTCFVHKPLAMRTSGLQRLLPNYRLTTDMLRGFCIHLLHALDYLHTEAGLIHTDIKAANILLENKDEDMLADMEKKEMEHPSEFKVFDDQRIINRSRPMPRPKSWGIPILCDFGEARSSERKYDDDIMPEIYRAPELAIWNLGVMIWDLYEGKYLFDSRADEDELSNIKHLSQIVAYLGPPCEFLKRNGNGFLFFNKNFTRLGTLIDAKIPPFSFEAEEENLEGQDKELLRNFMRLMLCWLPEHRKTAKELLEDDPWINFKELKCSCCNEWGFN